MGTSLAGAAGLALAALPLQVLGAGRSSLTTTRLADNLLLVSGAGANVVVARDAAGLVFVDGGLRDNASDLLALASRELGAKHAHALINTHWHPEQTGLNEKLGKAGAKIIAHVNTKLWLGTDVQFEPDGPPVRALPARARPNDTTYGAGKLSVADEEVRYGYLPQAHTDGDLYVLFTKANVLVTGGVVAGNAWPTADWVTGGWINGTVAGYKTLIDQCDANTRVVSANGTQLLTRADLESQRAILAKVAESLGKMMRSGYAPADMLAAAPAKDYEPQLGDATEFLTQSFKSLWPRFAPDA